MKGLRDFFERCFSAFFCAVSFLTILPVDGLCRKEAISICALFFPLVGFCLGVLCASFDLLMLKVTSTIASSAIVVALLVLLTGGMHIDGLADLADAFGAGGDAERQLEVMRDVHVGAFGATSVCIVLLLKVTLIASLKQALRWKAICLMPMLGRWCALLSMFSFPYARGSDGVAFALRRYGYVQVLISLSYVFLTAFLMLGWGGIVSFVICSVTALLISASLTRRLGGLTGDCYGAIVELCEVLCLICFNVSTAT
jgi:adenosylcobinamide-GDP ribazoletransferase